MDGKEVKICVDHRESELASMLLDKGVNVEKSLLEVGDFILSDDVVVELKTSSDFVASLIDGRLFKQAKELKNNFNKPLYIIEGDIHDMFDVRDVHPNALRASLVSLSLDHSLPILFSRNKTETVDLLFLIAKREQLENGKEVSLRGSRKCWTLAERQRFLIEGLPLVGPKLARNLLKEFGSPTAVLTASYEDLQKVDKMGKKKSETVRRILDEEYKEH